MLNLNSHTIFDTKFRSLEDGIRKSNSFRNNRQGILKNKEISDWWMIVWCCLRHIGSIFQQCKGDRNVCNHMILTNKQIQWQKHDFYSWKSVVNENKNASMMKGIKSSLLKNEERHTLWYLITILCNVQFWLLQEIEINLYHHTCTDISIEIEIGATFHW